MQAAVPPPGRPAAAARRAGPGPGRAGGRRTGRAGDATGGGLDLRGAARISFL